jgi:hypothetical protein
LTEIAILDQKCIVFDGGIINMRDFPYANLITAVIAIRVGQCPLLIWPFAAPITFRTIAS